MICCSYSKIFLLLASTIASFSLSSCSWQCKATAKILYKTDKIELYKIDHLAQNLSTLNSSNFKINREQLIQRHMLLFSSEPLISNVIDRLVYTNGDEKAMPIEDFIKNLRVNLAEKPNVISVSYYHSEGKIAKETINKLLEVYIEYSIFQHFPAKSDYYRGRYSKAILPKSQKSLTELEIELKIQQRRQKIEQSKQEYAAAIKRYEQKIEAMNKNVPSELEIKRYQSPSATILSATTSCPALGYFK